MKKKRVIENINRSSVKFFSIYDVKTIVDSLNKIKSGKVYFDKLKDTFMIVEHIDREETEQEVKDREALEKKKKEELIEKEKALYNELKEKYENKNK